MSKDLNKKAGIFSAIKATGTWLTARKGYSSAQRALSRAKKSGNIKSIKYRTGLAEEKKLQALAAKKNIKLNLFGKIKKPDTKTTGTKRTTKTTQNVAPPKTPEAPKLTDKKYSWKALAGAGAAGFLAPKLLEGSGPEYPQYPQYGYPRYGEYEKQANVGKAIGRLLKAIGGKLPDKGSVTIGKAIVGTGTAGLGGGLVAGYVLGDDGHDAASHGRRKTAQVKSQATYNAILKARHNPADSMTVKQVKMFKGGASMTPMEKADQKYAIAKSYERSGHPRKATEYKDKASQAYKRAWEKKSKK